MSAITTKPIVPANESNIFNQYSPAPVQNIRPTTKQNRQTVAENVQFKTILKNFLKNQIDFFSICVFLHNFKIIWSLRVYIPVTYCLRKRLNISMSNSVQSIPSSRPIWEPRPNDSSIVKNNTAQNGAPGNDTMACVNTMNAKPVPSAASLSWCCKLQFGDIPHRYASLAFCDNIVFNCWL